MTIAPHSTEAIGDQSRNGGGAITHRMSTRRLSSPERPCHTQHAGRAEG